MPKKNLPYRKCLATGQVLPKEDLLRLERGADGKYCIDPSGHGGGRGAYLIKDEKVIQILKTKRVLERALHQSDVSDLIAQIEAYLLKKEGK